MKKVLIALCAAATCSTALSSSDVSAQTSTACTPYAAAVTSVYSGAVPIVPDSLLTNWKLAVSCLVPIIAGMKDAMRADSIGAQARAKFLSATGALRAIATKIGTTEQANAALPAAQQDPNVDTIEKFASEFRKVQTIDAVAVLTTGARSDNYDMRLSAILVLGNVIDERYACVPLVQIFDPDLKSANYFVKARANLLGMLSRIAPFVYKEDFANIRNVQTTIGKMVSPDDPNLAQTRLILQNIDQRLAGQTDNSNRAVPLERDFKERCVKYMTTYPATNEMTANIKY